MKNKILSVVAGLVLATAFTAPAFAADEQFLPDVENLTAEVVAGGVYLTWDAVAGADSYTIYYGTQSISEDGASYENSILLGDELEYTVEDLLSETTYYFAAAADDSTGVMFGSYNYSEEVSATTLAEDAPIVEEPIVEEPVVEEPVVPLEDIKFVPEEEPQLPAAEELPQSGPATAALMLISTAGAYAYRRFRKVIG